MRYLIAAVVALALCQTAQAQCLRATCLVPVYLPASAVVEAAPVEVAGPVVDVLVAPVRWIRDGDGPLRRWISKRIDRRQDRRANRDGWRLFGRCR